MNADNKIKHRISVAVFFFINGYLYANWVSRLPELKIFFGIRDSTLGTLLLMTALGALVSMPLTGWMVKQRGNKSITIVAGLLFSCLVPFVVVSNNLWIARLAFFSVGFGSGAMDVSMNGQAVLVERLWKKSIMSSFHAVFSIGMAMGAATGSLFSYANISIKNQLLLMTVVALAALLFAAKNLVPPFADDMAAIKKTDRRTIFSSYILVISVIAFCGMTGEGSMSDWSAIYMHTIGGKNESVSAIAFFSFGIAMTVGRLSGDYFINRLGRQTLLMIDCAVAITGLSLALILVNTYTIIFGFFLVGLGLSTIVPLVYSTAGNLKGIEPSAGIATASTIGYTGFFIGPPTIGYLSDHFGLRIALCYPLLLFIAMFLLVKGFIK